MHSRWGYSIQRCMGVLTNYVTDKSSPKASMALGYNVDNSLGFCIEFFQLYPHSRRRIWDSNKEIHDVGEKLMGAAKQVQLSWEEIKQIYHYIITNSGYMAELYR